MLVPIHFDLSGVRVVSTVAVDATTPSDACPQVMFTVRFVDDRGDERDITCLGAYDQRAPKQGVAEAAARCFQGLVETQLKIG